MAQLQGSARPEMAIRDVVTTMVVPAVGDGHLENHARCEMCGLDEFIPDQYVPLLLLFEGAAPSETGLAGLVEELKQALAKVLVAFYPLAGRVVHKPGHPPRLLCNDAGAVFTSAHADAPMSRVYSGDVGADFQPVPEISGTATSSSWRPRQAPPAADKLKTAVAESESADPEPETEVEDSEPALVVQVTRFECGGVALAVNWLHPVADGFSGSQFLKAWSDACGSGSLGPGLGVVEPDHGRAQTLKKEHFLDGALEFSDHDLGAVDRDYTPPGLERVQWTRDMAAATQALAAIAPTLHTPKVRLVHYTEAGIRKLKALTAADVNTGEHFSTVTCVSAHLWRCVSRARLQLTRGRAEGNGAETSIFMAAVDAKVRRTCHCTAAGPDSAGRSGSYACASGHGCTTLLPASYFGNSILMARTREVEREEVVRRPLGFVASLIKDCVAGIHLRAYQYLLGLVDKHGPCNISLTPRCVAVDFITSSWYRFPFYDLHFCFPAKPVLAAPNFRVAGYPAVDDIVIWLPSPLGPNNLIAMLFSHSSDVMASLPLDQEFVEYAY